LEELLGYHWSFWRDAWPPMRNQSTGARSPCLRDGLCPDWAWITGHAEVIHADVQRLLLTCSRSSRFGSHIRIPSQLTTEECH